MVGELSSPKQRLCLRTEKLIVCELETHTSRSCIWVINIHAIILPQEGI